MAHLFGDLALNATSLLLAAFGLTLAGIVKGATGLGYASSALPFLVMAVGLKPAMGLVILPALATNINLALATGHLAETLRRFAPLYATMLPGIVVGLWLLTWVDQRAAVQVLGVVMLSYAGLALARPSMRMPAHLEAVLQWPTGLVNGIVTGLTGAQVMPLFPYVMALQLEAARTVQAINLAVLVASTVLAVGLAASGLVAPSIFALSIAAIVPALVGVRLGTWARTRISDQSFRRVALATLMMIGVMLVLR